MARHEHLPIYKAAMDCCVYLENTVRNFSRYNKYTLGKELRDLSRSILLLIIRANSVRDKEDILQELTSRCDMLKTMLVLAKEVRAFESFKSFHDCTQDYCFKGDRSMLQRVPAHKSLFHVPEKKGLPIGNLTSQFFANVYLNELDQFVKHRLKCRYYIRYVDDCILVSAVRRELEMWQLRIEDFLAERLALQLKEGSMLRRVSAGADFLGYIVRPDYLLSRRRVVNNLKARLTDFESRIVGRHQVRGRIVTKINFASEAAVQLRQTLASYLGHFKHAGTHRLVRWIFKRYYWLNELFFINGCRLYERYRYGGVFRNLRGQIRFFKSRLPDVVTLFRVGRYVELYNHDAIKVAALLRLKIRNGSRGVQYAAGFPFWFQERFIDRMLAAGHDVAVVAQGNSGQYVRQRYVGVIYRSSW